MPLAPVNSVKPEPATARSTWISHSRPSAKRNQAPPSTRFIVGAVSSDFFPIEGTLEAVVRAAARLPGFATLHPLAPDELAIHLGPAICGRCYEVSTEVREQLTGQPATRPGHVDLRSLIAEHAAETGVQKISVSTSCTRCDNDRFFSHRAGDQGRQIGVIAAQA